MGKWSIPMVYAMGSLALADLFFGPVEHATVIGLISIAYGLVCVAHAIDGRR